MREVPGRRRTRPGRRHPRAHHRPGPRCRKGNRRRCRPPLGTTALIPAETGMGTGREPGAADRGRAPGAAARDPAVHRDPRRRRHRRRRPPVLRPLRPRNAHRQAAGRRPGLPDLHRALPHRAVRTLRSRPRARHPRRAGQAGLRELLHHRPGEPGDLHRMRARPPGRPPDRGRAALRPLSPALRHDLHGLRPDGSVRDLPGNREALVPGLPAPPGRVLSMRAPRGDCLRHPGHAALRPLHPAAAVGRLPRLQRPGSSQPRPVRSLHHQRAAGRADGARWRAAAARPAGAVPRDRHRRARHHRDTLAGQAVHRPGAVRPRRRQHPAHPPGARRTAPAARPSPTCARPSSPPARCRRGTRR